MANVYVKDIDTDEIIHTVETNKTGRALEKMVRGMLMRIDLDRFYVDDSEADQ